MSFLTVSASESDGKVGPRIENHAEDIKLSTLTHYAEALGKKLDISIQ